MGVQVAKNPEAWCMHPITEDYADFTAGELSEFKEDIRKNGLRVPIVVWRDQIVDGRHRYQICSDLGIDLKVRDISQECLSEDSMREMVTSLNQHRRSRTVPLTNGEKRKRVEAELMRNPSRSARGIARELGVAHTTVLKIRRGGAKHHPPLLDQEVCLKRKGKIQNAPTLIDRERGQNMPDTTVTKIGRSKSPHGPRVKVPDGMSLSDLCRSGLKLEEDGKAVKYAAQQIGMEIGTYSQARAIIHLSIYEALSAKDASQVRSAIELMDQETRVTPAYQSVLAIVEKVWGKAGKNHDIRSAQERVEKLKTQITITAELCARAAELAIPHLSAETQQWAKNELSQCRKYLALLMTRIGDQEP